MRRSKFYVVAPATYLFAPDVQRDDERTQLEEPVRQWCAFELMRVYGVKIGDIRFEHPVKIGSKTSRIDILVLRNGDPWIVIECKEPSHTKHSSAHDQAISYAGAASVGAEFAVYTNGETWLVRRRVNGRWVSVADLPTNSDQPCETIIHLLSMLSDLCPLLYQLDQETKGNSARRYMAAMQRFFVVRNIITQDADKTLVSATEHVLRVLSIEPSDSHYRLSKIAKAASLFQEYASAHQLGVGIPAAGTADLRIVMIDLHAALMALVENSSGLTSADILLVRLNAALTEYGQEVGTTTESYPLVEHHIHEALRLVLEYGLKVHLNLALPDPLDRIWKGDMREYCRNAWETFDSDPHRLTTVQLGGLYLRHLLKRLIFWKRDR